MRAVAVLIGAVIAGCGGAYRDYPRWTLGTNTVQRTGCVEAEAFVRVSGKTGVGVTLALRSFADCRVRVARAELVIGGERIRAELPPTQVLPGRSLTYVWLPFPFDNNQAWNDGQRTGEFELVLSANDVGGERWAIPATHRYVGGRWKPDPIGRH